MKTEQQQQAQNLFFQTNLSQVQIAKLLDVDRKTIYNWVSEGNWRRQKKLAAHMPSIIAEQLYYQLANLNHEILSRSHQPYPLTHEAEQIRKLTIAIKNTKNRQTINESMESFTHLAEMISSREPELAARLNPYIQEYIQHRVDVKFADLVADEYQVHGKIGDLYDYEIRPQDDDETTGEGGIPETSSTPPDVTSPAPSAACSDPSGRVGVRPEPAVTAAMGSVSTPGRQTLAAEHASDYVTPPSPSEACPDPSGRVGVRPSAAPLYARVRPNPKPSFIPNPNIKTERKNNDTDDDLTSPAPVPISPKPAPPTLIAA